MGKKRIEDADITLEEAIALLEHPQAEKSSKTGSINYGAGLDLFRVDDVKPAEMIPFVMERFTPGRSSYVAVRHEAYLDSRSAEVEHVLKLEYGGILGTFGEKSVKGEPFRHATLKFSMAKYAGPVPSEGKETGQERPGGVIGAFIHLGERILGPLPDGAIEGAPVPQPEPNPPDEDYKSS